MAEWSKALLEKVKLNWVYPGPLFYRQGPNFFCNNYARGAQKCHKIVNFLSFHFCQKEIYLNYSLEYFLGDSGKNYHFLQPLWSFKF